MNNQLSPDVQKAVDTLMARQDFKVLRRLEFPPPVVTGGDANWNVGAIVDTETTGLNAETDEIIELGILTFWYDDAGQMCGCRALWNGLREPAQPITPEITRITGITSDMVAGKSFDLEEIAAEIEPARIVIAHNARFDRPFCARMFPWALEKHWACSHDEIPWKDMGAHSTALQCLAWQFGGFFFDGHRASEDAAAVLHLLESDYGRHFKMLMESAREPSYRVWANGAPYDSKDALKNRGYRWEPDPVKCWYRDIREPELGDETDWLNQNVLKGTTARMTKMTAKTRYLK